MSVVFFTLIYIMALKLTFQNLLTYGLMFSPIMISTYILIETIVERHMKGFIFLLGAIISVALGKLLNNAMSANQFQKDHNDVMCNGVIDIGYPAGSPAFHTLFFTFTAYYLGGGMVFEGMDMPTGHALICFVFFHLFIFIDASFRLMSQCIEIKDIILGYLFGLLFAFLYFSFIYTSNPHLIYFNESDENSKQCTKTSNKKFQCRRIRRDKIGEGEFKGEKGDIGEVCLDDDGCQANAFCYDDGSNKKCKDKSAQYEVCNKDDHCLDESSRCLNDDGSEVAVDGTDAGKCYRVNHYDVGTLLETGGIEQECKSGNMFENGGNSYCTYAEYDTACTDDGVCGVNMSCFTTNIYTLTVDDASSYSNGDKVIQGSVEGTIENIDSNEIKVKVTSGTFNKDNKVTIKNTDVNLTEVSGPDKKCKVKNDSVCRGDEQCVSGTCTDKKCATA